MKNYSTLIDGADGTRLLENPETGETTSLVDGKKYIFVTMPDGTIRIGPPGQSNQHAILAGHAPYVKFAGEVSFKDGKEVDAIAQSGSYLPPLDKGEELSGLRCTFRRELPRNSSVGAVRTRLARSA